MSAVQGVTVTVERPKTSAAGHVLIQLSTGVYVALTGAEAWELQRQLLNAASEVERGERTLRRSSRVDDELRAREGGR